MRSWIAYGRSDFELSYWRTRAGTEIDFIVYGPDGFWAVEVKNSSSVRHEDFRALRAFREDYPSCEPLLVYRGEDRLAISGVRCIPAHDFLTAIRPGRSISDPA